MAHFMVARDIALLLRTGCQGAYMNDCYNLNNCFTWLDFIQLNKTVVAVKKIKKRCTVAVQVGPCLQHVIAKLIPNYIIKGLRLVLGAFIVKVYPIPRLMALELGLPVCMYPHALRVHANRKSQSQGRRPNDWAYCSYMPKCIVTTKPDRLVLIMIMTWLFFLISALEHLDCTGIITHIMWSTYWDNERKQ